VTSTIGRLYAAAISVVVFFVAWAAIAAKPWIRSSTSKSDPRLATLQTREIQMQARALAVQKILDKRWSPYRAALAARASQLSAQEQLKLASAPAGPSVQVKAIYLPGTASAAATTRTSPLP
jgi:hypothetical protein